MFRALLALGVATTRRGGTIALAVWLPAIVLIAICVVGLILSPP
jgi:hypothetical protein